MLACFCYPLPGVADEATDDFKLGVSLYRKSRYQLAADTFEAFLEKNARHPRAKLARLYFGLSLHSLEQYEPARRQFDTYINDNPTSPHLADARYRAGESSFYLRDYETAIAQLTTYLKMHEGHELNNWAELSLGGSYNGMDKFADAEPILRALLESGPDAQLLPETQFELGRALEGQNKNKDAIEVFQKLVDAKTDSFSVRALARIGTIHYQEKDYTKASETYDIIVAGFPSLPIAARAALQSGKAQMELGNFRDALEKLKNVPDSSPESKDEATLLRGLILRNLGELDPARELLKEAYAKADGTDKAAEILYRRAELEHLDGRSKEAAQMFIDLADRWPDAPKAADSLFGAAEAKMELGDLKEAHTLLDRLTETSKDSAMSARVQILRGRILLVEGKPAEAVAVLKAASDSEALSESQNLIRSYHLIRALFRNRQFDDVLLAFDPLKNRFIESPSKGTSQAVALAAVSCLELKQYEKSQQLASEFLAIEENPARRIDAIAARAVALASLQKFDNATADINQMVADHANAAPTWQAVMQAAEAAWQAENYEVAARFHTIAAGFKADPRVQETGMAGLAWSQFELGQFDKAANSFQSLSRAFPISTGLSEAEYMTAFCLDKSGNEIDAARGFLKLFDRLEPDFGQQEEGDPDRKFAWNSGRAYARLAAKNNELQSANDVYQRIAKLFAGSDREVEIYDEWASLNYDSRQFEKADSIYQILLNKFPQSKFAGKAHLALAESAMVDDRLDDALVKFKAISVNANYADDVKEPALAYVIDILSAKLQWGKVLELCKVFEDKYGTSDRAPRVRLFFTQALLDQKQLAEAKRNVDLLRKGVVEGLIPNEEWTERIWVVQADIALADKRYADIDETAKDLLQRKPNSKFAFQLEQIQGLRWKTQAEPDFDKARDYFKQVTQDKFGRGTESAARCQFLIAETFLLQKQLKKAVVEYFRVSSFPYPKWQGRGLYQMAMCEESLNDIQAATRTLTDLIRDFPNHEQAANARKKLAEFANGP